MTECSRCGTCCDPVSVGFDPAVLAEERLADPTVGDERRRDYEFLRDHWSVISGPHATTEGLPGYLVSCDQYDRDTRSCTAQNTKPAICAGFPWYGRAPRGEANEHIARALAPQCSFNADVRRMLPLTPVGAGQ